MSEAAAVVPGGSAATAEAWFGPIVNDSNLADAWPLTAHALRVALVQGWLLREGRGDGPDRDEVARALAVDPDISTGETSSPIGSSAGAPSPSRCSSGRNGEL